MDKYYIFLLNFLIVFFLGIFIAISTAMASGVTSEYGTSFANLDFGTDLPPLPADPNKNYYDNEIVWKWPRETLIAPAVIALILSLGLALSIYFTRSGLSMPTLITLIIVSIWGITTSLTCLIIPSQNVPTVKKTYKINKDDINADTGDSTIDNSVNSLSKLTTTIDSRPASIPTWFATAFIITIIVNGAILIALLVRRNYDIL